MKKYLILSFIGGALVGLLFGAIIYQQVYMEKIIMGKAYPMSKQKELVFDLRTLMALDKTNIDDAKFLLNLDLHSTALFLDSYKDKMHLSLTDKTDLALAKEWLKRNPVKLNGGRITGSNSPAQ